MAGRRVAPERLDDAAPEEARANLRDIARINRWFGAHRILCSLARPYVEGVPRVLDVGAASGDMGRALRRRYPQATVVSLDQRPLHLEEAPEPRVAADAFHLPFRPKAFDVVMCSLFLHQFEDEAAAALLAGFARLARRAVLAIDLERRAIARGFLPATSHLFGWSGITLHDGPVSVEAGWRTAELAALALRAGLRAARVRRHDPWFRLSLVAEPR